MKGLTQSQRRSIAAIAAAILLPIISIVILNESKIEATFPDAKWLPLVFPILATFYTSWQRSLKSTRSGTGTGVVDSGPDPLAQAASATSVAVTALAPVFSQAEQVIVDLALAHFHAEQAKSVQKTADVLKTATEYALNAADLTAGHEAINAAKAAEAPISPTTPGGSVAPPVAVPDAITQTGGNQ